MKRLAKLGVMSFACVALSAEAIAETPQKVLRFVPQYESTVLDPVTSILQVTHQAALLPYDTLMARDAANEVRPQMLVHRFLSLTLAILEKRSSGQLNTTSSKTPVSSAAR